MTEWQSCSHFPPSGPSLLLAFWGMSRLILLEFILSHFLGGKAFISAAYLCGVFLYVRRTMNSVKLINGPRKLLLPLWFLCFGICGEIRIIFIFNHLPALVLQDEAAEARRWEEEYWVYFSFFYFIEFISNHRVFKPMKTFRPPAHKGQIRGETRVNFSWNSTETALWKHYCMYWA